MNKILFLAGGLPHYFIPVLNKINGLTTQYEFSDNYIHNTLIENGFETYSYIPEKRELIKINSQNNTNTIYCRDINFFKKRIETASKIKVGNKQY